eukprot:IDg11310t1
MARAHPSARHIPVRARALHITRHGAQKIDCRADGVCVCSVARVAPTAMRVGVRTHTRNRTEVDWRVGRPMRHADGTCICNAASRRAPIADGGSRKRTSSGRCGGTRALPVRDLPRAERWSGAERTRTTTSAAAPTRAEYSRTTCRRRFAADNCRESAARRARSACSAPRASRSMRSSSLARVTARRKATSAAPSSGASGGGIAAGGRVNSRQNASTSSDIGSAHAHCAPTRRRRGEMRERR